MKHKSVAHNSTWRNLFHTATAKSRLWTFYRLYLPFLTVELSFIVRTMDSLQLSSEFRKWRAGAAVRIAQNVRAEWRLIDRWRLYSDGRFYSGLSSLFYDTRVIFKAWGTKQKALLRNINYEIKWNADLMQLGNFIHVFLARRVSGTYAHHQEH